MKVYQDEFEIRSSRRTEAIDITRKVEEIVEKTLMPLEIVKKILGK